MYLHLQQTARKQIRAIFLRIDYFDRRSNSSKNALRIMHSTEKSLKRKKCTDAVAKEIHKLLDQGFVTKIQ